MRKKNIKKVTTEQEINIAYLDSPINQRKLKFLRKIGSKDIFFRFFYGLCMFPEKCTGTLMRFSNSSIISFY